MKSTYSIFITVPEPSSQVTAASLILHLKSGGHINYGGSVHLNNSKANELLNTSNGQVFKYSFSGKDGLTFKRISFGTWVSIQFRFEFAVLLNTSENPPIEYF